MDETSWGALVSPGGKTKRQGNTNFLPRNVFSCLATRSHRPLLLPSVACLVLIFYVCWCFFFFFHVDVSLAVASTIAQLSCLTSAALTRIRISSLLSKVRLPGHEGSLCTFYMNAFDRSRLMELCRSFAKRYHEPLPGSFPCSDRLQW